MTRHSDANGQSLTSARCLLACAPWSLLPVCWRRCSAARCAWSVTAAQSPPQDHDFTALREAHSSAAAAREAGASFAKLVGADDTEHSAAGGAIGAGIQRVRQAAAGRDRIQQVHDLAAGNAALARFEAALHPVVAEVEALRAKGVNLYDAGTPPKATPLSEAQRVRQALPCHARPNAEYGGEVVKWGEHHVVGSADECCQACRDFVPEDAGGKQCNVWVYCPGEQGCANSAKGACWLKYAASADSGDPPVMSADSEWTSGAVYADTQQQQGADSGDAKRKFHMLVTSNHVVYQQWQTRVMYFHYKKQRAKQGEEGAMGGFTRILHSGKPDNLMDEIPTVVVDDLRKQGGDHGFVVLSRPNAFIQWAQKLAAGEIHIDEDYVMMGEPDHLILRPIPNLMKGDRAACFPFFYIEPEKHAPLIQRLTNGAIAEDAVGTVARTGSSPVQLRVQDLAKIAPIWHNVSLAAKQDAEADKAWGWVLEMYGYAMAAAMAHVPHDTLAHFQAQPPWDHHLASFYILHYTYGMDYTLTGEFMPGKIGEWRFDKRAYTSRYPPKNLALPPQGVPELVVALVQAVNEASAALPDWPDEA